MHCASCEKGMDRYILLSERASYLSEPTEGFTFCGWDCVIAFSQKQVGIADWPQLVRHLEIRVHDLYQAGLKTVIAIQKQHSGSNRGWCLCDCEKTIQALDEMLKA
jgi:hypothetical protein